MSAIGLFDVRNRVRSWYQSHYSMSKENLNKVTSSVGSHIGSSVSHAHTIFSHVSSLLNRHASDRAKREDSYMRTTREYISNHEHERIGLAHHHVHHARHHAHHHSSSSNRRARKAVEDTEKVIDYYNHHHAEKSHQQNGSILDGIKNWIADKLKGAKDAAKGAWNYLSSGLASFGNAAGKALDGVAKSISTTITSALDAAMDALKELLDPFLHGLGTVFEDIISFAGHSLLSFLFEGVSEPVRKYGKA